MIRKPAVAGQFYPADPSKLSTLLQSFLPSATSGEDAFSVIVPHAGYQYSGHVAGATYAAVRLPRRFVLLCPNHTGVGSPISLMRKGVWETPLGGVEIDTALANEIKRACLLVQEDILAHRDEHALEVQIPFLQHLLSTDFRFVPLTLGTARYESLEELGNALAAAVQQVSEPVLFIASSDLNHFEPALRTLEKDQLAINAILRLESRELFDTIHRNNISMCGFGPAIAVIQAARRLGATRAELIEHTHSGEITGDESSVVGYAGIVIR